MSSHYFYDEQIRRFLLQFARMFSNFEVEGGVDDSGNVTLVRVPIRYGDSSRNAQVILQENSRNNLPCAPMMSFYINSLKYDRPRIQEPHFVDRRQVRQREWDETSQTYETTQGNAFLIERPMPVPYALGITLDIWTSNTNQKLQLIEQIATLFNPSLEIQSTDNYLDWTSLSVVELEDITWTSRNIPNGDESIDIASMKFNIPIWISPPARVTKEGVIHKVIASIYDDSGSYVDAIEGDNILLGTRIKITPHGYKAVLLNNEIRAVPQEQPGDDGDITTFPDLINTSISWHAIIDEYGALNDGISQIRLEPEEEGEPDIIGTVAYHPSDENVLLVTIDPDTLPVNTLDPIDAVIDPLESGPGIGLPPAATGQRYLLLDDIGNISNLDVADAWQGTGSPLEAKKNDIIEFNGSDWFVAFSYKEFDEDHKNIISLDPNSSGKTPEFVTNLSTGIQYKYKVDNGESKGRWRRSYEGIYPGGRWGLVL